MKDFYVTKGMKSAIIKSASLVLTMADSLIQTQLKTNFITADFQSRASLADLKKALKNSMSATTVKQGFC